MISFPHQSENMSHSTNSCTEKGLFTANRGLTKWTVAANSKRSLRGVCVCVCYVKLLPTTHWMLPLKCHLSIFPRRHPRRVCCHRHLKLRQHSRFMPLFTLCLSAAMTEVNSTPCPPWVQLRLTRRGDKTQGEMLLGSPDPEQTTAGCEPRPRPDPRLPDVGVWISGCGRACGWLH